MVSYGAVVNSWLSEVTDNVVHRADDHVHLVGRYDAVTVDVIELERPLELLEQCASQQQRQTHHELLAIVHSKFRPLRATHDEYLLVGVTN